MSKAFRLICIVLGALFSYVPYSDTGSAAVFISSINAASGSTEIVVVGSQIKTSSNSDSATSPVSGTIATDGSSPLITRSFADRSATSQITEQATATGSTFSDGAVSVHFVGSSAINVTELPFVGLGTFANVQAGGSASFFATFSLTEDYNLTLQFALNDINPQASNATLYTLGGDLSGTIPFDGSGSITTMLSRGVHAISITSLSLDAIALGDVGSVSASHDDVFAFSFAVAPVPEPSTWAMLLIGFAGIGFAAYRRTPVARN